MKIHAPISKSVGPNLASSPSQFVCATYCTGTKSLGEIPSSRCEISSLRSKESTLPIEKK